MTTLHLYNTLTGKKDPFIPFDPDHVKIYVCGPTVYDRIHVGNARAVVVFDVLVRLLRLLYPRVTYARNITDIDDKIITAAQKRGLSIEALTHETTCFFHEDIGKIEALPPDHEPRATAYIPQMIQMITTLIQKGSAYEAEGHVLFRVSSFPSYGRLSGVSLDEQEAGARVEVAPYKDDPRDFVLWKPSSPTKGEPGWDSPWGLGRPGWHLECSAMSQDLLGLPFDLHGGGRDLTFPHHENERAQSCAAVGCQEFVRHWVHNGILTVEGEKMSKSLGNFVTLRDALGDHPGEVIRWVLLSSHYRHPLDWTGALLHQARSALDRLYTALREDEDLWEGVSDTSGDKDPELLTSDFFKAMCDDLNTPLAFASLHTLVSDLHKEKDQGVRKQKAHQLFSQARFLGFLRKTPRAWFQEDGGGGMEPHEIEVLIHERNLARAAKDFTRADTIRATLLVQGIVLEDGSGQTRWKREMSGLDSQNTSGKKT